jgi:hypothetical protein
MGARHEIEVGGSLVRHAPPAWSLLGDGPPDMLRVVDVDGKSPVRRI